MQPYRNKTIVHVVNVLTITFLILAVLVVGHSHYHPYRMFKTVNFITLIFVVLLI